MMPIVDLDLKRSIEELKLPLKNGAFSDYCITEIFEGLKLRVDEAGAKVENQAVMALNKCLP